MDEKEVLFKLFMRHSMNSPNDETAVLWGESREMRPHGQCLRQWSVGQRFQGTRKGRKGRKGRSAASRNHREDGGWKSRKKSQGNAGQGNNRQNAFSHSLDNHSPDFALENVFKRVGGRKIFAKLRDSEGLQYKERREKDS